MALTDKQIEELFLFCEKKFVRHYDLQVELVDHLAERIEEEMAANGRLSFDEALQRVYAGFGIFGFAHIVQDRANALEKQHRKFWLAQVKTFFVLPRILLTLALACIFYQLAKLIPGSACGIIVCLAWFGGYIFQMKEFRRLQKSLQKNLMLTQYLPAATSVAPVIIAQELLIKRDFSMHPVVFAVLMVIGIVYHAAFVTVVKSLAQQARKLYPQAFKAA